MKTRQQLRNENVEVSHLNKRQAIEQPEVQPRRKRPALSDLSNAISNVLIDSAKKPTAVNGKGGGGQKLQRKVKVNKPASREQPPPRSDTLPALDESVSSGTCGLIRAFVSKEKATLSKTKSTIRISARVSGRCSGLSSSSTGVSREYIRSDQTIKAVTTKTRRSTKQEQEDDPCSGYDYDKENLADPFSVPHYANDIFLYYKSREKQFKVGDYMKKQRHLSKHMRAVVCDWMVEVQESFELNHETLYLAVKMTDLYLDRVRDVHKDSVQLVASAAMFIAAKFDERQPPLIDDLLYVCEDAYDKDQMIQMEIVLLKTIDFDIGMPLSYRFLRRYAKAAKIDMATLTLARYALETSLMFYEFVHVSESLMGAAALLLALTMKQLGHWSPILHKYSGFKAGQVEPLMWKLNHMLKMRPITYERLQTIFTKYSHQVFFKAADTPLLLGGPDESVPVGPPPLSVLNV